MPPFCDSLLGKLIVWDTTRAEALALVDMVQTLAAHHEATQRLDALRRSLVG